MSDLELLNGDCLELLKDIPSGSIDCVVTDPPYLIENRGCGIYSQAERPYIKELEDIKDGFSTAVLDELCRCMNKINIYLFCSQRQLIPLLTYFVQGKGCNYNLLTWHKSNPVPACGNKYLTDTEYILFFREKGVKVYGTFDTKHTFYVTPINLKDKKRWGHPTIKPLQIVENLIVNSTLMGGVILDPFMGSGTTGVAALKNGRRFIGMEINEDYFRTAERRIKERDGKRELELEFK